MNSKTNSISDILKRLAPSDERCVSFREFVTSPDFCNDQEMYEYWLQKGDEIPDNINEIIIDGSLGGGKCGSLDMRISTNQGYLSGYKLTKGLQPGYHPIEGLKAEQSDGSFRDITHVYYEKDATTLRFKTRFGAISARTKEHPALSLTKQDKLPTLNKAGDLRVGDVILIRRFTRFILDKTENLLKWYLYGYAVGDATYSESTKTNLVYEGDLLFIEWLSKIELRKDGTQHKVSIGKPQKSRLTVARSTSIIGDLIGHQNSHTKSLNSQVFVSKTRAFATLMGLLASDGGCAFSEVKDERGRGSRKQPPIEFSTASILLSLDVQNLLNYLSIPFSLKEKATHYTVNSKRKAASKAYRFRLEGSFLYRAHSLIQELYKELNIPQESRVSRYLRYQPTTPGVTPIKVKTGNAQELVKDLRALKCNNDCKDCELARAGSSACNARQAISASLRQGYSPSAYSRYLKKYAPERQRDIHYLEDFVYSEITEIEEIVEDVYDITVPDGHLFMADNCVNHNTYWASYQFVYYLYCLFSKGLKMRKYLGVAENTPLYALYFSTSKSQANRSGFKQIKDIIDNCKWFTDKHPRDSRIESEVRFNDLNFSIIYASAEGHQISLNIVAFILDEANFRKGVGVGTEEEYSEVTRLYQQLIDRQISRFGTEDKKQLAILISSASYQSAFTEERKQKVAGDPHTFLVTAVGYKIKPWLYSKEMFTVFTGTELLAPQIIENEDHLKRVKGQVGADRHPSLLENLFIKVPTSLKREFQVNIQLALQNHAGVPTQMQGRLVKNLDLIRSSYYEEERPWFPQYQVTLSNKDDVTLFDYLDFEAIREADKPHFLALDLSVGGDSAGLTCIRLDDIESKKKTHIFTIEIIPPGFPAMTKISKVQDFIIELAQHVYVAGFSTDQYQSQQLRQNITEALDLPDIRISVDSSDELYLIWLENLVDSRLKMLYYPNLQREIKEAVHDVKRRRVVKAANSTDDLIQSLVAANYLAEIAQDVIDMTGNVRVNVIGNRAVNRIARRLGYK